MSEKQAGRWAGLVAAAFLLVLCTLLLWGTQTAAAGNPLPPSPASPPPGGNTPYSSHPASPPDSGDSSFRYRPLFGGDVQNGDTAYANYLAASGSRVRAEYLAGEVLRAEFWLEVDGRTSMWGEAQPGSAVTVTTPISTYFASADPSCPGCWNVEVGNVFPGDVVTVEAAPGNEPVVITVPDPLTSQADSATDQVWGQIGGWGEGEWIQVHGYWDDGYREVQTDAGGNYLAAYGDVPRGARGHMRAERQQGDTWVVFHRPFQAPDLILNVNYGHDWVEGNYEPGYTVWLTVTDAGGGVKATVELETQVIPWWNGQSGFSTNLEGVDWSPGRPDIQEGDWVHGRLDRDEGYTGSARMGTINGALDLDADTVAGTISAPWFGETLNGNCGVWVENGPGQGFQVEPDGGSYACDFTEEWDLLPGQDVGVQYQEPDGDWVINVFRSPAPNMRVEKWAEGSGQVVPGGPAVFSLRYRNEGDAPATTIRLTDTLPAGTTYVADSSGATPAVGPGWVAWTLGPLDPGQERRFQLVLTHSADPGENLHNVADISTLYDFDTGNNHAEADANVVEEAQPDLYVNKNPNPGDPAPGQTMLWEISYGNNGPVASGPVVLSDTLPAGTSIHHWESDNAYGLWTDASTAGQLRLEAPTLPGYWGDRILLWLLLDPGLEIGTQLTNTVEIITVNDANPDDNWHQRNDVKVNWPRWNGFVDKSFGWGQWVPGGEAGYNLHIRNHGNMATSAIFTDTLPAGTTFVEARRSIGGTDVPFPPDSLGGGIAVWDLGVMEPGQWYNLNLRLAIDGDLEPGTVLTNCANLAIGGDDEWPQDNVDCVVDTVNEAGPNLRVYKEHQWNGDGQLQYTVSFLNIGTSAIYDVEITDQLPAGTSFNGNWWHWFWEGIDFTQVGDQLVWTLSRLEPGWSSGLSFQVDLAEPGAPMRWYTNTVDISTPPGDVNPADNSSQDVAFSGGEVQWVDIDILRTRIWGCAYDVPVTVKTASAEMEIWDNCWDREYNHPFLPGDVVTVTAGAATQPVVIQLPDPFTAQVSSESDTVWGQIDALDHEWVDIDLWDISRQSVQTDDSGHYSVTYDDLPRGAMGDVNYRTKIDYADVGFHRRMDSLDLLMNVNYSHDWVEGNYEPGHTLWLTVTASDGSTEKATAELQTQVIPWWGGQTGFSTNLGDPWIPGQPDIQEGDWVYGRMDNGYTSAVQMGTIAGFLSTGADSIRGTIDAPWIAQEVAVECHPWGAPAGAPNKHDTVLPNGVDTYSCSWDPDTEWDVQLEQDVGVSYEEPDGDRVFAVFRMTSQIYLPVVMRNH